MKKKYERTNYSYLNILKEIPLLIKLEAKNRNKEKDIRPKSILIINTCLIGDFIASLPALRYFIKKNKIKVDLVVSPLIKTLAEHIKGVKKVFIAKSIYERDIEKKENKENKEPGLKEYDLVLIMRLSGESYNFLKKVEFKSMKSYLGPYLKYTFHLIKRLIIKGRVKQWREINFEIINEKKIRNLKFEEIFEFQKSYYNKIKKMSEMKGTSKKIIVHTGSGWNVKLWSNQNWVNLLKKLNKIGNFKFIFIGSKKEKKDFEKIQKRLNFKIYSLANKISLKDLLLVMRISDYFIGVDSGPRHMAHLVDLPSVCLLGPGPKYFMPINPRDIVLDKSNCRCTNLFCYKRETCVQKIGVDEVFQGFKKLMNN